MLYLHQDRGRAAELAPHGGGSCIVRRLSGGRLGHRQSPVTLVPALVPATWNRWGSEGTCRSAESITCWLR